MTVEHANQFYIDGRWRPCTTSASNSVVDPASEELVGEIAAGGPDDVDFAVAAARRAFHNFSRTSVEERVALLGRILELIQQRAELFVDALVTEMGAAITFARASQVPFAAEHVRVSMDVLRRYRFLTVNGTTATAKEAIGVCALITPWNWPLYQITAKVGPAIGAGSGADGEAGRAGTRRQVAQRVPRRCRFCTGCCQGRASGVPQCRPVVQRADPDVGPGGPAC